MKAPHQPITGHNLLAVEQYLRRFLSDDGYAQVLDAQRQGRVRVYKHAAVIEGHIMPPKPKRRRK